jgi:hypothetical protein
LSRPEESIVLSSITILIYLNTPNTKSLIASPTNTERMLQFSKSTNRRIKNLADIFLQDLCGIKVNQEPVATVTSNENPSTSSSTSTNVENSLDVNNSTDINTSTTKSEDKQTSIITNATPSTITSTVVS